MSNEASERKFSLLGANEVLEAIEVEYFCLLLRYLHLPAQGSAWGVKVAGNNYLVEDASSIDIAKIRTGDQSPPKWATHAIWRNV